MREVSVAADRLERWLAGFSARHGATQMSAGEETVELAGADGARAWVAVPFPPLTGDLVAHVRQRRRVGVLLVRRGGYAAGVFDGAELVASKVGAGYVQGGTKAGGWSQQRYARRRANQATAAFAEAADVAARVLGGEQLDALVAGGDRAAVRAVLADPRLAHLQPVGPWLEVKDPKHAVLVATEQQFRAVRIRLDP
ncbi:MAG TPA: acVLRF1 family peptidyl-tRNA hydrolase [Jatrophihabitans sp.]|nr:acVLRF1 family peptidyl-tRNA hydrolase [Jatrophihabitans sp.]